MKKIAIAATILITLTGCAAPSSPTSDYSSVVKEEVGNFIPGKDLLLCNMHYAIGGDDCNREIELMVFSSQRIIKKFKEMSPSGDISQLVGMTIRALEPVANSGFSLVCSAENKSDPAALELCRDARIKIAGPKDFVLQDVWDSLDAWQVYF